MESAVAGGGHGGALPIQGQVARKEWRVVNDSSGRERLVGDGLLNHPRVTASARQRPSSGASRGSGRNGQMFHPSGSGHSSDSDHHTGDIGATHIMGGTVSPQQLISQSISQGDEAVLYEEIHRTQPRTEPLESGLSSLSRNSGLNFLESSDEAIQQQLHEVSRQRKQFQQAEVELRAQYIARSEFMRMQNGLEEQSQQHSEIVANLQSDYLPADLLSVTLLPYNVSMTSQSVCITRGKKLRMMKPLGQIQEREQRVHHLEQQLEERERQLHVNQMETNEAVWAKDGLLREQTNELATLRRELDSAVSEHKAVNAQLDAERTENMAQLENLKEQVREKERQIQEIEEQHRTTHDLLLYKDEQLRDAQAWMARAQELDAYHVNTNNQLHVELRDRMDQVNQLWVGCHRQLADSERYHSQIIQRLQQELAEVREQHRQLKGSSTADRSDPKDEKPSRIDGKEVGQLDRTDDSSSKSTKALTNGSTADNRGKGNIFSTGNIGNIMGNGTTDGVLAVVLPQDGLVKVEHAAVPHVVPTPLLSMTPVLPPPAQVASIHQFGLHQQGVLSTLHATPLPVPQAPLGQLQPMASVLVPQQHLAPLQHPQVIHHHRHHSQQHQVADVHRLSQRPQQQPVLQQPQAQSAQQHPQHSSTSQAQGQTTDQEHHFEDLQQEEASSKQSGQGDQESAKFQSSGVLTQQHAHIVLLQQQQSSMQGLHSPQQGSQVKVVVTVADQDELSPQSQQPQQEEKQVLSTDCKLQEEDQQSESGGQHRKQGSQQGGQVHEQRRRIDSRVQHYCHHQPKQPQSPSPQILQHDASPRKQQLQHQQGILSNIEHLAEGSHTCLPNPLSQEESASGHAQREVAGSNTSDNQEVQHMGALTSKQQNHTDASIKGSEPVLLDERSLLACLVRAVPAEPSTRIRIGSTLPNRLGKMLAPLHWHDYRKQYGRLDEFVGSHPELFVIEGDFIHLREGAHATVSATTAVAKASAAAAAVTPLGQPCSPTVAVTPVATPQLQRVRSLHSSSLAHLKDNKASVSNLDVAAGGSTQQSPLSTNPRHTQITAVVMRSTDRNGHQGNSANVTTVNTAGNVDGMLNLLAAGSRSNGGSLSASNDSAVSFENGGRNGYTITGRGSGNYATRNGRGSASGSGQNRKQENYVRPQFQEGRVVGASSLAQ